MRRARAIRNRQRSWWLKGLFGRGRPRALGTLLAAVALSLQIAVPVLFTAPLAALAETSPSSTDIVICSAHGLITLSGDATTDDATDKNTVKPIKCPLCQAFQGLGTLLAPTAASIGPHRTPSSDRLASATSVLPGRTQFDPLQARAPPLTAQ